MLDLLAFPDHSKVWIYASDKFIDDTDIPNIHYEIKQFADQWVSHASGLKATGGILHNYFIVLVVDEQINKPGGCSIDSSVRFIKSIGEKYNVDFFNRNIFHYIQNEEILSIEKSNLDTAYQSKKITDNTLFFDPLVDSKITFIKQWLKPFGNSWHKRLM